MASSMVMDEYRHERLKLPGGFMRLLQIQGTATIQGSRTSFGSTAKANDLISLRITQYAMSRRPAYLAVSYTWGSATLPLRSIRVNGRPFLVRQNLWTLLWHLRQKGESRFLWIDALCIDQKNLEERNFHVSRMGRIYEGAGNVIVWLGLPSEDRRQARVLEFIEEMATLIKKDDGAIGRFRDRYFAQVSASRWVNLLELCRATYWTRTWIIQEFLQASVIEVWCGTARLEWRHFEDVVRAIREVEKLSPESTPDFVSQVMQSLPVRLTTRRIFHTTSTLEELISEFYDSKCAERRDKIYGILGIADDCGEQALQDGDLERPKPDYSKHIVEVYFDVFRFLVQSVKGKRSPLLAIGLTQRSLGLGESDIKSFFDHVSRQRQVDRNAPSLDTRLSLLSLPIKPDYINIISEVLPGWTSIRDLRQRLEQVDWAKYVGHEVKRKPLTHRLSSSGSTTTTSQRKPSFNNSSASLSPDPFSNTTLLGAIQTVRADLPTDMLDNAIYAAEHADDTLKRLYNIPTTTTTTVSDPPPTKISTSGIPTAYLLDSPHDKRLHLNEALHKPNVIIESRRRRGVDPARIGFSCTDARAGDLICQFTGLEQTLVVRRVDGGMVRLVGYARMLDHVGLKGGRGVHPRMRGDGNGGAAGGGGGGGDAGAKKEGGVKWSGVVASEGSRGGVARARQGGRGGGSIAADKTQEKTKSVSGSTTTEGNGDNDDHAQTHAHEHDVDNNDDNDDDDTSVLFDDYTLDLDPISWWEILRW